MKKVAIVSTGHPPFDERIFDKIGKSLIKSGNEVSILVTTKTLQIEKDGIKIIGNNSDKIRSNVFLKINFLLKNLKSLNPDIIINCEPFPVLISFLFTLIQKKKSPAKIIYDITEWYPENIYLKRKGLLKIILFLMGHLINFIATNLSDYLLIGEETKLSRYRKYSPKKKYSIISYYPVLEYYQPSTKRFDGTNLIFGYAGVISVSRGLDIYYQLIKRLTEQTKLNIGFILAGRFEVENEKIYLEKFKALKIDFQYFDWVDYSQFSKFLEPVHICLDIRPPNKIYERSLPIKIFDYMALGKCIVASNYEPIRKIFEIAKPGILVNPENIEIILSSLLNLLKNPEQIYQYGNNGRTAVEQFFNWKVCEIELEKVMKYLVH